MKNALYYILRRSTDFNQPASSLYETLGAVATPTSWWQRIFGTPPESWTVPRGRLSEVVDLEGADLHVLLEGSDERLVLYPRFRIVAVTNPERAFAVLRDHYDAQLMEVRQRIHNLFSTALGLACDAETLNSVATHTAAKEVSFPDLSHGGLMQTLPGAIADDLGLEVHWKLELNQTATDWIRRLKAALSAKHTLEFNKESRTSQFRLTYSMKVVEVKPASWVAAQRRSHHSTNLQNGIADEMQTLHAMVFQVLDPAFGVFGGREKVWEHPQFWQAIRHAFQEVVQPRLESEFGYTVEFSDFKRERTEAEQETLKVLEQQDRLQRDFDHYEATYKELLAKRSAITLAYAEIPNSPELSEVEAKVATAKQKMQEAQRELETASTGNASNLSALTDKAWTDTFTRFFGTLRIEAPQELLHLPQPQGGGASAAVPSPTS